LSALKKSEHSEDLILRLYNPSDDLTQAFIQVPFATTRVELVGLDELPRTATTDETNPTIEDDRRIKISLAAKKITTLQIERT
jgi:alpha-mannosidase